MLNALVILLVTSQLSLCAFVFSDGVENRNKICSNHDLGCR